MCILICDFSSNHIFVKLIHFLYSIVFNFFGIKNSNGLQSPIPLKHTYSNSLIVKYIHTCIFRRGEFLRGIYRLFVHNWQLNKHIDKMRRI